MPNEPSPLDNGSKNIRIPLPGLVDRALVALLGALLGFSGTTVYQGLDPNQPSVENKEDIAKNDARLLLMEDHMLDCVDYRREDMKAMAELWKSVWKLQNDIEHMKEKSP